MKTASIVLAAALAAAALGGEAEYERAARHASHPAATPWAHGALPGWETAASGPLRAFPEGLRPVEYVEFDEHQIVDLGYVFTPRDKVEVDWQFMAVVAKQQRVLSQRANPGLHIELYINGSGSYGYAFEQNGLSGWKQGASRAVTTARSIYGLDGPNRRMYNGTLSWTIPDLSSMSDAECGSGNMFLSRNLPQYLLYARCYGCKFWKSGILVRDYHPATDANGIACLVDFVSGECAYSATDTPLVAGPLVRPATSPPLAAARRNWYASALLATNAPLPVVSGERVTFDTMILPEGCYATRRNADEIVFADSDTISALVARYRDRLASTNIPVWVEHDRLRPAGRVTGLWRVVGEGLWARVEASAAIVRAGNGRWHASAEMRVLRATAADDWGPWAEFVFPWAITGLAFTMDPAIETPAISDAMIAAPVSPYPGIVPEGNP